MTNRKPSYLYTLEGLGNAPVTPGNVVTPIGGAISSAALLAGPAAPIVAAIGGAVALAGQLLNVFGIGVPDMKKIQASNDANQVEQQMAQVQTWWAGVEHTKANQDIAVDAYNQLWNQLVQLCSDSNLGDAGRNCIGDRQRGGKWDWFAMHLDPIVNTPLVTGGGAGSISGIGGWLIGGVALVVGLSLLED